MSPRSAYQGPVASQLALASHRRVTIVHCVHAAYVAHNSMLLSGLHCIAWQPDAWHMNNQQQRIEAMVQASFQAVPISRPMGLVT